jgi:hypothetical protein
MVWGIPGATTRPKGTISNLYSSISTKSKIEYGVPGIQSSDPVTAILGQDGESAKVQVTRFRRVGYAADTASSAPHTNAPPSCILFSTEATVSEWTLDGGSRRPAYSLKARIWMSRNNSASSLFASHTLGFVLIE